MTIGERIKELRKHSLKLTQTEFGEKIGLKQAAVGLYENGQRGISDQSISLICQAFNVREEWLREGKGEMFQQQDNAIMQSIKQAYHLDGDCLAAVEAFLTLPPDTRAAVLEAARTIAATFAASPQAPASAEPPASAGEDASTLEETSTVAGDELDADPAAAFARLRPDVQQELMRLAPAVKREKTREALTGTSLLSVCAGAGEA